MFKAHSLPISQVFNTETWLLSCILYLWLEAQVNYIMFYICVLSVFEIFYILFTKIGIV